MPAHPNEKKMKKKQNILKAPQAEKDPLYSKASSSSSGRGWLAAAASSASCL